MAELDGPGEPDPGAVGRLEVRHADGLVEGLDACVLRRDEGVEGEVDVAAGAPDGQPGRGDGVDLPDCARHHELAQSPGGGAALGAVEDGPIVVDLRRLRRDACDAEHLLADDEHGAAGQERCAADAKEGAVERAQVAGHQALAVPLEREVLGRHVAVVVERHLAVRAADGGRADERERVRRPAAAVRVGDDQGAHAGGGAAVETEVHGGASGRWMGREPGRLRPGAAGRAVAAATHGGAAVRARDRRRVVRHVHGVAAGGAEARPGWEGARTGWAMRGGAGFVHGSSGAEPVSLPGFSTVFKREARRLRPLTTRRPRATCWLLPEGAPGRAEVVCRRELSSSSPE